jgi:hypothetical protein
MPSEAAAWCDGVLGAACTGESRCSGRGFLRGIVGLCGGSARHVERAVAGGVFGARARATRRVRRVSGGSGVMLWPVAPRRGSCFPCAWWRMMLMLGGVLHGSRDAVLRPGRLARGAARAPVCPVGAAVCLL